MTRQRKIILEELRKTYEHPNASEVYEKVKQRLPHISLGTVYRNLEILSVTGKIKRLKMSAGQRRFDAGMHDHHHIRCISCGRVDDIASDGCTDFGALVGRVSQASGYTQLDCAVEFSGICPDCARGQAEKERKK